MPYVKQQSKPSQAIITQRRFPLVSVTALAWAVTVMGVALRFRQYLFDRSMWNDEAELALAILNESFVGLSHPAPLDTAPLGFAWVLKIGVDLFGSSERAFRLVPIIAGVIGVVAFRYLALRVLRSWPAVVALTLFALSPSLIYFSGETKPYGLDATVVVLMALLYVRLWNTTVNIRGWLAWGVAGAITGWFSYPAALVTAVGFVALGVHEIQRTNAIATGRRMAAGAVAWLASAGVEDVVTYGPLHRVASIVALGPTGGEPPKPLHAGTAIQWVWDAGRAIIGFPLNLDFALLAAVLLIVGTVVLWWRSPSIGAFTALMVVGSVLGGLTGEYPFAGRTVVYLVPLACLALGGLVAFSGRVVPRLVTSGLVALVGISLISQTVAAAVHPYTRNEGREALEFALAHRGPDSAVIVEASGTNVMAFYNETKGLRATGEMYIETARSGCNPSQETQWLDGYRTVWLLFFGADGTGPSTTASSSVAQPLVGTYERDLRALATPTRRYDFPGAVDVVLRVDPRSIRRIPAAHGLEVCDRFYEYPSNQRLAP